MTYTQLHLAEAAEVLAKLDIASIERMAQTLADVRARGGRLFFLGVGGSAANCGHAVNDFRKLAGFEAYAPTDNVSELTARTNDEGWETVFVAWLRGSRLRPEDGLVVFSVGGGSLEKNVSSNLVRALQYGREVGAAIVGVVGRDGGYTAQVADACVIVPTVNAATITPHAEAFQAVIWHVLVSHPLLKVAAPEVGVDAVRPAVFLDRDGVINRALVRNNKPFPPTRVDEVEVLPGVPEALARLRAAGYALIVVTNQPDVARGKQTKESVQAIHDHLAALVDVDEFRVCFHDDADGCTCRKPKPGLLMAAPTHALERSIVVGDRWRDIEAGRRAGCRAAVFIDYGYDEPTPVDADTSVRSLAEAADWIVRLENET